MERVSGMLSSLQLADRLSLDSLRAEGQSLRERMANVRGPRDFFDFRRMSRPAGWGDAQGRISFNLRYFSANYTLMLFGLVAYSLVTNLLLLFVLLFGAGGIFAIGALGGADLTMPWGTVISAQSLYIGLGCIVVPLFIIASPIATLFWLIGAVGATVLGHAALMEKPLESEFGGEQV